MRFTVRVVAVPIFTQLLERITVATGTRISSTIVIAGGRPVTHFRSKSWRIRWRQQVLAPTQLASLKQQAIASGYYNGSPSGNLTLQQGNIPAHDGDVVVYVEYPSGSPTSNEVNLKFEWPHSPYTNGKALIIVLNGSVKLTGNQIGHTRGVVYAPDGEARADGGGNGEFTGYVWSKGFTNIGNFTFTMDSQINDPPFFAWTVTRETDWTECDG